jgi:hypothetical protein
MREQDKDESRECKKTKGGERERERKREKRGESKSESQ